MTQYLAPMGNNRIGMEESIKKFSEHENSGEVWGFEQGWRAAIAAMNDTNSPVCKHSLKQNIQSEIRQERPSKREIVLDTPQGGYHTISVHAKLPDIDQTVIVAGGIARYRDGIWYSGMSENCFSRPIQWPMPIRV